jgi:hypothetical protein
MASYKSTLYRILQMFNLVSIDNKTEFFSLIMLSIKDAQGYKTGLKTKNLVHSITN